ncbi:hypothetical protein TWF718_006375 [Orbilia javanica]|uniref:Uncharacterized protein n=1 Tax=Orbilia javanica TaxID=47235 RepID=A0AAN8MW82_9PEZI
MLCSILQLCGPQAGEWVGYIPTFVAVLGIGAVSMNYLRDYLESNHTTKKHRFPPAGGNIYIPFPSPPPPEIYLAPDDLQSQRFVVAAEVLDVQLEPIVGHTAWHNSPDFGEVRVPLEAEKVAVRGRPRMCYDGRAEMWWDGRKGVGLVRL